jgi:hypothetical protein
MLIHALIILFVIFGWSLPKSYLLYHIFLCSFIYIQWELSNQKCILTELEILLLNNTTNTTNTSPPLWFIIKNYLKKYNITNHDITKIYLYILIVGSVISIFRLNYNNYKK